MCLMSSKRCEYLALRHDTAERCHKNVLLKKTVINMILVQKYRKQNIYYMRFRYSYKHLTRNVFFCFN